MKICPIAYTVNLTESKGVKKSVESLWERSVNLQVIKSGDSIAQDVVVSGSAFGSILPEIRNLAIACICYLLHNTPQASDILISHQYMKWRLRFAG